MCVYIRINCVRINEPLLYGNPNVLANISPHKREIFIVCKVLDFKGFRISYISIENAYSNFHTLFKEFAGIIDVLLYVFHIKYLFKEFYCTNTIDFYVGQIPIEFSVLSLGN